MEWTDKNEFLNNICKYLQKHKRTAQERYGG